MSRLKQYHLNPETLMYEVVKVSHKSRLLRTVLVLLGGFACFALYFWLYTSVLGLETPKTAILRRQNAAWSSKIELLNREMDRNESALKDLEVRGDDIYRSIFGMNKIPEEVLNAGFGGVNRYAYLDGLSGSSLLRSAAVRLDVLTKQAYVQSKAYDEVANMSRHAGELASCIPAIPPVVPDKSKYRASSPFGGRADPISGRYAFHEGFDFAMKRGSPVYATGDGIVESVTFQFFGYGNMVTIDHGFGYKTRYAHLNSISVVEGMKIKRGECIGEVGNTGKTTGPHLHYEVHYRGNPVNPANFFDLDMSVAEYETMVKNKEEDSQAQLRPSFRLSTNR